MGGLNLAKSPRGLTGAAADCKMWTAAPKRLFIQHCVSKHLIALLFSPIMSFEQQLTSQTHQTVTRNHDCS